MSTANDAAKAALAEIKAGEGSVDPGTVIPESDGTDNLSDVELEAVDHGWTPEGVEGKRNLTAEEFMDRKPLYDDIRNLKKQTRKLQDGLEASLKMQQGIREREREKVIQELNAKKREALEENEYDQVMEIDKELLAVHTQEEEPIVNTNADFDVWVDENEWYHQNTEMREYADMIGAGYFAKHPKAPMKEVYEFVGKEAAKRFPDELGGGNSNRRRQSAVEGAGQGRVGSSGGGRPTKYSVNDLPEQDREIMNTILRAHPKMSKQDYLKQYFG